MHRNMKFGVVVFPGSNCDQDTIYVLKHTLGLEVEMLWHKDSDLKECEFIILPGGFSFGDYLRSGAIARFSPIMKKVISFAENGGYVLGICNGFQILTEAGLLPGALLHNAQRKFVSKDIFLKRESSNSLLTQSISSDKILKIPIAHGEGRYFTDQETLKKLYSDDQILFKYCNSEGFITEQSNPNGSLDSIAGICNSSRNVFGLMPHPERASNELFGNSDGSYIFKSILKNTIPQKLEDAV
jgi:phosphoribosylformylglycinamidine synthase subunit PurQ / glutaminase